MLTFTTSQPLAKHKKENLFAGPMLAHSPASETLTYIYCTTKTKTKRKEEEDEEKDKVPWIIPAAKIPTVEHEVGT